MGRSYQSIDEIVEEITRIHRSLPSRPGVDEVEAASALVRNLDIEEQSGLEGIEKEKKGFDVPQELFFVLQEMQKNLVFFQCKDQKREALKLLDLDSTHALFDELVQRGWRCLPSGSNGTSLSVSVSSSMATAATSTIDTNKSTSGPSYKFHSEREVRKGTDLFTRDDSYVQKTKSTLYADGITVDCGASLGLVTKSTVKSVATAGEDGEKLSLIKLASLIEMSSKRRIQDLDLQNKLMNQVEWLPNSIGKLSSLVTLHLSENHISALPKTIGALSSLAMLNLHSNRIAELPESIGDLFSLVYLDLRANQLTSLPSSLGKLVRLAELDLSSNHLASLPDTIGNLISLKKLIVETNDLEELPHTISQCTSLVELRADYNRLKGLPEAVGRIGSLEILSVRYNNVKSLPTTMASLSYLKEIDLSFNELESVPESLCLATTLVKMNIGNNFADLQSLPRSIGNLEMLEELNMSNNQIKVLPDSFAMLTHLRVLHAEENPLEVPPRHVAEMGAQAVVQYMVEFVAKRDIRPHNVRTKKSWAQFCFFSGPNKRKHDGLDYVKA
uniref:Malignant fibrous histiocytoma-amplified sequence 1 n=1 Tax=Anthurium amnicola TaxID=1678845 RepID=A0A1D1XIL4_9ARAE